MDKSKGQADRFAEGSHLKRHNYIAVIVSLIVAIIIFAVPADAQNRFRPVVQVGDNVVTEYQFTQRTRFLSLLRAPGDPRNLARDQLINESIQIEAARRGDNLPGEDQILRGLEEFASRADLTAEEFIAALGQEGVGAETYRDFVTAGIAWRSHVQNTFRGQARDIPDDLVNRTLARTGTDGGLRVLISEILLPATTPETTRASRARAAEISALSGEEAFATAARLYSVAASRANGGQLNWVAIDTLPASIQGLIQGLTPGQISRPIELENAIGVFFLRDLERVRAGSPETLSIAYALLRVPEGPAVASRIASDIDTCDDLYGIARDLPEDQLLRTSQQMSELPADIRALIPGLDVNETSTAIIRNNQSTVLMLCDRQQAFESTVDFELVGARLLNVRLGTIAADYLADLRADTYIADLVN